MARYYAPDLGRFISEDPAEAGANWYVYCGNNPLRFVDPSGLQGLDIQEKWLTNKEAFSGRDLIDLKAVVIHWTGGTNPATSTWNFFNDPIGNQFKASSNYIVGGTDGAILHAVPDTKMANASGGWMDATARGQRSGYLYTDLSKELFKTGYSNDPVDPNYFTLSIEAGAQSVTRDQYGNITGAAFSAKVEDNTVALTAKLLLDNGLVDGSSPDERLNTIMAGNILLRHMDVTDKPCPQGKWSNDDGWNEFKQKVWQQYESLRNDAMMAANNNPRDWWYQIFKATEPEIRPAQPSTPSQGQENGGTQASPGDNPYQSGDDGGSAQPTTTPFDSSSYGAWQYY